MKGKTKKIVLAVAVIGAIAAGGVAFTAANTVPDSVAGYGTSVVSGATATAVLHTLSADGTHIVATDLVLTARPTARTPSRAGFGSTTAWRATRPTARRPRPSTRLAVGATLPRSLDGHRRRQLQRGGHRTLVH